MLLSLALAVGSLSPAAVVPAAPTLAPVTQADRKKKKPKPR